jgi:hypothetical protein
VWQKMSRKKERWFEEGKEKRKERKQNWILQPHRIPHLDEYLAMWLLKRFGESKFPGISEAQVIFGDSGEKFGAAIGSTNVIPIGTGGGKLDEHLNGKDTDRIEGECAATLTAKNLGIQEMPELKNLLDYVLKHDSTGQRNNFDFADLVIAMNRSEMEQKKTISYVFDILDALYELKKEPTQKYRDALAEVIERWIRKSRISAEISEPIRRFINSLKNGNRFSFDITTIYKALFQKFGQKATQRKIEMFLDAKHKRQISFFEAVQEVRNPEITDITVVRRSVGEKNQRFVVVVGKSDNREYGKAARKEKRAAVVIQRKSSGRTFVFGSNSAPIKQEMSNLIAMIRLEEMLLRRQMPIVDYRKMSSAGTLDQVPYWHLLRGEDSVGQILNGSDETAPDIELTVIPLETIVKFTTMALKLGKGLNWNRHVQNAMRIHS